MQEKIKLEEIPEPVGKFILDHKDITPIVTSNGWYWHYKDVVTLLTRYAAAQHSAGCEWVKCSELKPEVYKLTFKDKHGNIFKGNYSKETGQYYAYGFPNAIWDVVEWRVESYESPSREGNKEREDNEALRFGQWVADNGWKHRIANEWCRYETIYSDISVKTLQELYNEYQKQNKC